jgi:hypothetical protein
LSTEIRIFLAVAQQGGETDDSAAGGEVILSRGGNI